MTALPQDVRTAIMEHLGENAVDLSRVVVALHGEEVVVKGAVNTEEEKRLAEDAVARLCRRAKFRCELEVVLLFEAAEDVVYEAGVESFPASDPPCWTSCVSRS